MLCQLLHEVQHVYPCEIYLMTASRTANFRLSESATVRKCQVAHARRHGAPTAAHINDCKHTDAILYMRLRLVTKDPRARREALLQHVQEGSSAVGSGPTAPPHQSSGLRRHTTCFAPFSVHAVLSSFIIWRVAGVNRAVHVAEKKKTNGG